MKAGKMEDGKTERRKTEDKAMVLTRENYHSLAANRAYMSNSQWGDWLRCEAAAYAQHVSGEYGEHGAEDTKHVKEDAKHFVLGRFMHASILRGPGWEAELAELERVKVRVGDDLRGVLRQRNGALTADGKQADRMLKRWQQEVGLHGLLGGEPEVVVRGVIGGVAWRAAIDSVGEGFFADLKTPGSLADDWFESHVTAGKRVRGRWYEKWNYPRQLAVYQRLLWLDRGELMDGYLVAISKDYEPVVRAYGWEAEAFARRAEWELDEIDRRMGRVAGLRAGEIEPMRCDNCRWCRLTDRSHGEVVIDDLAGCAL